MVFDPITQNKLNDITKNIFLTTRIETAKILPNNKTRIRKGIDKLLNEIESAIMKSFSYYDSDDDSSDYSSSISRPYNADSNSEDTDEDDASTPDRSSESVGKHASENELQPQFNGISPEEFDEIAGERFLITSSFLNENIKGRGPLMAITLLNTGLSSLTENQINEFKENLKRMTNYLVLSYIIKYDPLTKIPLNLAHTPLIESLRDQFLNLNSIKCIHEEEQYSDFTFKIISNKSVEDLFKEYIPMINDRPLQP
ncbi:MAG: hypothetical protein JWM09_1019 [Francisellaceae bacterium]|nr:hypothetical protein [Francisellaceae bacterium]